MGFCVDTKFYTPQGFIRAADLHAGFTLYDDARRFGSTVAEISEVIRDASQVHCHFRGGGAEIVCSGCQEWIALTQFELSNAPNPRGMLRLCSTRENMEEPDENVPGPTRMERHIDIAPS